MSVPIVRSAATRAVLFLALSVALAGCGQESAPPPAAPAAQAPPAEEEVEVELVETEPTVPDLSDPTSRAPQPTDPSLAPRLRKQIETIRNVQRFVKFWNINPKGIWSNTFHGIRTIQNPLDVWITQEIMFEVKPDFVVEAGTLYGGSAPLWAMYLEQINPEGRVITIDIKDNVTTAKDLDIWKRKVDFLVGSSTDPAIVSDVKRRVGDKTVMVILDSDHSEEHVFAELLAYSPIVSVGSYLVVQDTCTYYQPADKAYPGGCRAIERFLAGNDNYEIDQTRERYVLTNNANGFLRRIR